MTASQDRPDAADHVTHQAESKPYGTRVQQRHRLSRLAHFEALVQKLRINVAAYGRPDTDEVGDEHPMSQLRAVLTDQLGLTEDDLRATIRSGTPLSANRLHWAKKR